MAATAISARLVEEIAINPYITEPTKINLHEVDFCRNGRESLSSGSTLSRPRWAEIKAEGGPWRLQPAGMLVRPMTNHPGVAAGMNVRHKTTFRFFCVFALAILPSVAIAQTSSPAQSSPAQASSSSQSAATLPSPDKILDKYLEASGGRVAWQKLNSRESKGVVDVPAMNTSGAVEIYEKAPSKVLVTITIAGAVFTQGYDGKVGWSNDPQNGLREQTGDELAETRRDADFYHPLDMHNLYSAFKVTGTEDVGGHSAYVLEATPAEGGEPDKLYFATDTGLLVRGISQHHSPEGVTQIQEDFSDYRAVDGITVPFQVHQTNGEMDFSIRIDEMHHNIAIDDSKFAKPAVQ